MCQPCPRLVLMGPTMHFSSLAQPVDLRHCEVRESGDLDVEPGAIGSLQEAVAAPGSGGGEVFGRDSEDELELW